MLCCAVPQLHETPHYSCICERVATDLAPLAGSPIGDLLGQHWRIAMTAPASGYRAGDYVLTGGSLAPRDGDDVVIRVLRPNGAPLWKVRRYWNGLALGWNGNPAWAIDGEIVMLAGIVVAARRILRPGHRFGAPPA